MHQLVHKLFWYAALGACSAYCLLKGGRDERLGATIMFVGSVLTGALTSHHGWTPVGSGALLLGALVTVGLVFVAMRTDRWWPLSAAAFQIISTTALFAPVVDPACRAVAGYFGAVLWDYLTLAALAAGTAFEGRREPNGLLAIGMRA